MLIGLVADPESSVDAVSLVTRLTKVNEDTWGRQFVGMSTCGTRCGRVGIMFPRAESFVRPQVGILSSRSNQLIVISDVDLVDCEAAFEGELREDYLMDSKGPGRWTTIYVGAKGTEPVWMTDAIGAQWLFLVETSIGLLFTDDFAVAVHNAPGEASPDSAVMVSAVVLGYIPGNETLHSGITLAPAGTIFEWRRGRGVSVRRRAGLRYGDEMFGKDRKRRAESVIQSFEVAAADWSRALPKPTVLSLSAGLDSRTALAWLANEGATLESHTFGELESREVTGSKRVAELAGLPWKGFGVPDISWTDWEENIQSLGAVGQIQRVGWARSWLRNLAANGRAVVHGFLGDALTGKHLPKKPESVDDWLHYWVTWSVASGWLAWPGLQAHIRQNLVEDITQAVGASLQPQDLAAGHQLALHADLHGRQRRWVASQVNELARIGLPACFFYHPAILQLWVSLPLEDLTGQRLYKEVMIGKYPELFSMMDTERSMLPRRTFGEILRRIVGPFREKKGPKRQPIVIDKGRPIELCREFATRRIAHVRPALEPMFDVPWILDSLKHRDAGQMSDFERTAFIRVINLAHVLSLVHGEN